MPSGNIWLSYDLGVQGDYENLYTWLDDHGAKECGSSVAFLKYDYDEDLIGSLKDDLEKVVSLTKRSRIYVVHRGNGRTVGTYLFGRRRGAPWEGHGSRNDSGEADYGDT